MESWQICIWSCLLIIVFLSIAEAVKARKKHQIDILRRGEGVNLDTKYFAEMLDKKIEVRTMDDLIIGTLKEIDGDVLCIENQKKNGVEKTFVNKTYISMIRLKP